MPFHIAAWDHAFAEYGLAVDHRDLYELEGIRTDEVVDRLAAKYSLPLSDTQKADLSSRKRERYAEIFTVIPLAGAQKLVRRLAQFGYCLALVTGTTHTAAARALRELGVEEAFSSVISGDDVDAGKPAPDSYLLAARVLGTSPANSLVIENAPAGIEAARAAGLRCVALATYLPQSMLGATLVFGTVVALEAWVVEEAHRTGARGAFVLSSDLAH